ncbi:hypothetical protein [Mycobacterium sp. GA-2829]|uniref:hypothetical protein n=1 Tax=Mycobacterium sp. GA-2829 TaxID=1772283 RepID=UPI000A461ACF|nr:hypothetical protein [Mycobacterium sp. GA-2829]
MVIGAGLVARRAPDVPSSRPVHLLRGDGRTDHNGDAEDPQPHHPIEGRRLEHAFIAGRQVIASCTTAWAAIRPPASGW